MNNQSISIIGGADGPTSIFIAGSNNGVEIAVAAVAIMVIVGFILWKKQQRRN